MAAVLPADGAGTGHLAGPAALQRRAAPRLRLPRLLAEPFGAPPARGRYNQTEPQQWQGGLRGAAPAARGGGGGSSSPPRCCASGGREQNPRPNPARLGALNHLEDRGRRSQTFPQISAAASLRWARLSFEGRRRFTSHREHLRPPAIAFPKSR